MERPDSILPPGRLAFDLKELGEMIGESEDVVRNLVKSGRLKVIAISERRRKVTRHELCRFLQIPEPEAAETRQPLSLVRHQH